MSLNLNCNAFEMIQTPTQITMMCLVQSDGSFPTELTGKKALHAVQIYKQWVAYRTNGVWQDNEREIFKDDWIKEHLTAVNKAVKNSKKIRVWLT